MAEIADAHFRHDLAASTANAKTTLTVKMAHVVTPDVLYKGLPVIEVPDCTLVSDLGRGNASFVVTVPPEDEAELRRIAVPAGHQGRYILSITDNLFMGAAVRKCP